MIVQRSVRPCPQSPVCRMAEPIEPSLPQVPDSHQENALVPANATIHVRSAAVDWSKPKNKQRLKELQKLIHKLFWAFADVEHQDIKDAHQQSSGIRVHVQRVVQHPAFVLLYLLVTLYTLFGPDIALATGHSATNPRNRGLAVWNTIVFALLIAESSLYCWCIKGYIFSWQLILDLFVILSIVGDTVIATDLLRADSAIAGTGSRVVALVSLGARTGGWIRIMRILRGFQSVRLILQLFSAMQGGTKELAFLLWQKRVRHVLHNLDKSGEGRLTEEDIDFFNTAMSLEFPGSTEDVQPGILTRISNGMSGIPNNKVQASDSTSGDDGAFTSVMHDFVCSPVGKRSFVRCTDEINCMRESCAIVDKAGSRLTLKVCVLVLMLVIMNKFVDGSSSETLVGQGLRQLDLIAQDPLVPQSTLCTSVVGQFAGVSQPSNLLLLVLDGAVFQNASWSCQQPGQNASKLQSQDLYAESGVVDSAIKRSGLEEHELSLTDVQINGTARSVALFDISSFQRSVAVRSIGQTIVITLLLLILIVFFTNDMRRLSGNNVLHPLWDLMDDMCALKSIEVLTEPPLDEDQAALEVVSRYLLGRSRCKCTCSHKIPVADELVQLRKALDKLHVAMVSWSKYVPVVLLKQLLEAGVEAKIGCNHAEVSVFFCDVRGFKDLCEDMRPHDVLDLLSTVLTQIYEALEEHGGTMLEFIGDEVLAVFNAPNPVQDHSMHAVMAALEALERTAALPDHNVRLQCSVNKAQVLAGNIGSPTRMKYGVLGDGVNLTARLKSLNTRYGTQLLVSTEALSFPGAHEIFLTRPVGDLILKGRTTPTVTYEVLAKQGAAPPRVARAALQHRQAFQLFKQRQFKEASALFEEAGGLMEAEGRADAQRGDRLSKHLKALCDKYEEAPPPAGWDGSEHLDKKAW